MDIATPVGLALGFVALIVGFILEGGSPAGLIQISAALIVFGGTFGAALTSVPLGAFLKAPKLILLSIKPPKTDARETIALFTQLADKARREGLLSLEEEASRISDPFLSRALMLVVDGVDPDVVREITENEVYVMLKRHKGYYGVFESMGGYSPTMGIIGTVMGLISVLGSLDDPEHLGHKIAVAFIACLYGVAFANLVFLPIATKLKGFSEKEAQMRELMIEGVLAVQAGENPRVVREKLETFLAPAQRGGAEGAEGKRAGAGAAARAQA